MAWVFINSVPLYSNYTIFTSKTMSVLFQKDTLFDNIIKQISADMKGSAKLLHDNALIVAFVAAFLSIEMRT